MIGFDRGEALAASDSPLEELRVAFSAAGGSGPGCGEPEQIWEAAIGLLRPTERRALVDHTVGCGACATLMRLARELAVEAAVPPPAAHPLRAPRLAFAAAGGLLAAAALLLVPSVRPEETPIPVTRSVRGGSLRALSAASLPRQRFLLRWSAAGDGARYSVTLTTPGLDLIHERTGLLATEVRVPETALANLPPGAALAWTVEAILPDRRRVESPAFLVSLQ